MGEHTRCRICERGLPAPFFDLGAMPLANAFPRTPDEFTAEVPYPLAVAACPECGLIQLTYVVPAEQLYREYIYVSATSDAVRAHARSLAAGLVHRYGWGPLDLVVEIASNDGTVLRAFREARVRILGVEPARNVATLAEADGVPTVPEFFTEALATALADEHGPAAAIIGRHVFAHVDDLHDFLRGVSRLLAADGVLVIEVPYLGDLIDRIEFDTIYHEHLSYFALEPVEWLCAAHDLRVTDVERVDLHGGSMVLHIRRAKAADETGPGLERMRLEERSRRLNQPESLERFAREVAAWKRRFEALVGDLVGSGARLIGYGAAAKANTLLNYCPEAAAAIRLILDRSPLKHGRYTPGTHIPVVPVERLERDPATHMVILAWNFREEIMRQMRPFSERGGRFVVPIPEPQIL